MKQFFSTIKQAFHKNVLILGLIGLLSLSGLFVVAQPSALAASDRSSSRATQVKEVSEGAYSGRQEDRQAAYDEATKAINDPRGIEKIYEEDLEAYEETQPDKGLVESAKEAIQTVTGND